MRQDVPTTTTWQRSLSKTKSRVWRLVHLGTSRLIIEQFQAISQRRFPILYSPISRHKYSECRCKEPRYLTKSSCSRSLYTEIRRYKTVRFRSRNVQLRLTFVLCTGSPVSHAKQSSAEWPQRGIQEFVPQSFVPSQSVSSWCSLISSSSIR